MLAITTRLGWATLHGDNLADTPYRVPEGLLAWRDIAASTGPHRQRDAGLVSGWVRLEEDTRATSWKRGGDGRWSLHGADRLQVTGRLIGGCVETMCNLADRVRPRIGHVPPHLLLVNGAVATVTVDADTREIVQELR